MTPVQVKNSIRNTYLDLREKGVRNLRGIIESRCRDGARHNGQPEAWRWYMPAELKGELR